MFSVSVANAEPERLFSRMKHIKTETPCSLGAGRLGNIVRVEHEGPSLIKHDPLSVMGA